MERLVRFDWALKRLLRNKANFVILEGFLSELLKEDVRIQEILESESNKEDASDKQNRVDLLVKNDKDEYIIIEVQQSSEIDYFHRMLYATSKLVTEQIKGGMDYGVIKRIISINIVYFDLGQGNDYVYRGKNEFKGLHDGDFLQLSKKQRDAYVRTDISQIFPEYYIIKVNNFDDVAKDTLDEWIYFFKNSEVKDEFRAKGIQKAKEELDIMKLTENERRSFEAYMKDWRITNNEILTAKLEGREEAEEKAYREKLDIARSIKQLGILTHPQIAEKFNLSLEVVEKL